MDHLSITLDVVRERLSGLKPDTAIVLGSGLGPIADAVQAPVEIPFSDLAAFPQTSITGHGGSLVFGRLGVQNVMILKGRAHYYEHGRADIMALPLRVMKELGCRTIILTNSAGSLNEDVRPGNLMLISDHINMSGTSPLIGMPGDAQFVDLSHAYDPDLQHQLRSIAADLNLALASGVYVWMSGPQFETPAEIKMLQLVGGGAVGMSTVPEVILARQMGLRVAAISSITNMGAGMQESALSHEQTLSAAAEGATKLTRLLIKFFADVK